MEQPELLIAVSESTGGFGIVTRLVKYEINAPSLPQPIEEVEKAIAECKDTLEKMGKTVIVMPFPKPNAD